ncbi:hypothetical protein HDE_06753 [Halotydeus destructor]|nr:hypothetical protein HDE_06753 [Halotydeus destructor]
MPQVKVNEKLYKEHLDILEESVTCQICDGWMEDPAFAVCGHIYCRQCVIDAISQLPRGTKKKAFECSECKSPIYVKSMKPAFVIEKMIESIRKMCDDFEGVKHSDDSSEVSSSSGSEQSSGQVSNENEEPDAKAEEHRMSFKRPNEELNCSKERIRAEANSGHLSPMPPMKKAKYASPNLSTSSSEDGELKDLNFTSTPRASMVASHRPPPELDITPIFEQPRKHSSCSSPRRQSDPSVHLANSDSVKKLMKTMRRSFRHLMLKSACVQTDGHSRTKDKDERTKFRDMFKVVAQEFVFKGKFGNEDGEELAFDLEVEEKNKVETREVETSCTIELCDAETSCSVELESKSVQCDVDVQEISVQTELVQADKLVMTDIDHFVQVEAEPHRSLLSFSGQQCELNRMSNCFTCRGSLGSVLVPASEDETMVEEKGKMAANGGCKMAAGEDFNMAAGEDCEMAADGQAKEAIICLGHPRTGGSTEKLFIDNCQICKHCVKSNPVPRILVSSENSEPKRTRKNSKSSMRR